MDNLVERDGKVKKKSREEQLLSALELDKLTDKESTYMRWLINRSIPMKRKRELFRNKFPNSKWLK